MSKRIRVLVALGLVTAVVGSACSDATSSPTSPLVGGPATRQSLLGGLLGTVTGLLVPPVQRTVALANDVSWSFTVGTGGGAYSRSDVGLTIVVPSGAVAGPTQITVTALAGSPVAYKFEPHGLVFARKVTLTQSLKGTTANALTSLLGLQGAYFASDRLEVNDSGLASVTELLSALVNPLTNSVSFGISHFSGYIVASGRSFSGDGY